MLVSKVWQLVSVSADLRRSREREESLIDSIKMSMRKKIQKKFRIRGYYLKIDALDSILSFADQFPGDEEGESIDLLLDHLQMENRMPLRSVPLFY